AEQVLAEAAVISVQVLNEFASVATRKLKMTIAEASEALAAVRAICQIVGLSEQTHDDGLQIAERYGLSIYDAMIVAAALLAGCKIIFSEDMQNGMSFDGSLGIANPFADC